MENSSALCSKIGDCLKSIGFPYISQFEAALSLLAAFFILLLFLWLAFRRMRLWYWKTNIQIDTLNSIDFRLKNVEEQLLQNIKIVEKAGAEKQRQQDETEPSDSETSQEKATADTKGLTVIGKSGTVYTEAELEIQIRD